MFRVHRKSVEMVSKFLKLEILLVHASSLITLINQSVVLV